MRFTFVSELNHKPNRNGLYAIFIRITQKKLNNQKPIIKRVDTGIAIKKTEWSKNSREVLRGGGVKSIHPNASIYNRKINELILKAERFVSQKEDANIEEVKAFLQGRYKDTKNFSFFEYCNSLVDRNPRKWGVGTIEKIQNIYNKLRQFVGDKGREDLLFGEFNNEFLVSFEATMLSKLKPSSSNKIMKILKMLLNAAIEEGVVDENFNPFKGYKFKAEAISKRVFLDEKEICMLEQADFKDTLHHARNFFLMQFYTAGKRVSDILLMKFTDITDEKLSPIDIEKIFEIDARYSHYIYKHFNLKPNLHSVKLPIEAKKIIYQYYQIRKSNVFVFPYLKDELSKENFGSVKLKNQLESKNALINKYLKKIAELLGLPPFSTHTARRSFAQMARKYHDKQYDIMEALGHSDFGTTQIYFDKTDFSGIDRAIEAVMRKKDTEILPK